MSILLSFAQNLAELLYKAAEETGNVNPTKVKEILGISLTDGETTDAAKQPHAMLFGKLEQDSVSENSGKLFFQFIFY